MNNYYVEIKLRFFIDGKNLEEAKSKLISSLIMAHTENEDMQFTGCDIVSCSKGIQL